MALKPLGTTEVAGLHASLHQTPANVVAFGATGDGSTDDSDAIQDAITAVSTNGGTVFFPEGTYKIETGLTLSSSNVRLVGAGHNATIIKAGAALDPMFDASTTAGFGRVVEGITFDGNNTALTCLTMSPTTGSGETSMNLITRNLFKRYTTTGVKCGTLTSGEFGCHVTHNFFDGRISGGMSSVTTQRGIHMAVPDSYVAFNRVNSNREAGIYLESGGIQVLGNHIFAHGSQATASNYPTCIKVVRGGGQVIVGNYLDNAKQNAMLVVAPNTSNQTSQEITITGNYFIEAAVMRNGTDTANSQYAMIELDATTAAITGVTIANNVGTANSTTTWSTLLKTTTGGSVSVLKITNNSIRYCDAFLSGTINVNTILGPNSISNSSGTFTHSDLRYALTDAATVAVDATLGRYLVLSTSDDRTIGAPTFPLTGRRLTFEINNASAGSITTSWNATYKKAGAWTDPGAGKRRKIQFTYDGTNWIEDWRSAADI